MNRLTNPFSSVVPLQSTDAIPIRATTPSLEARTPHEYSLRPSRSHEPKYNIIYDDPRRTHFHAESSSTAARRAEALGLDTPHGKGKARFNFGRGEGKRGWGVSTLPGSGRISCMAKGVNGRFAVGGGQYLRVLHVRNGRDHRPERIDEVVNLWKPSYLVDKSVTDLDWGSHELSHKLFSATPSGNFLIFDIPKARLDREVRGGHTRPINVIRTSKSQGHSSILITGGTEGQARIFDIRAKDPNTRKHYKHSGAITSLTFAPDSPHQFLVGLDNGSIQRYDMRNQYKATGRVWGAHGNKAVMDLKWKDGMGGWLASAGEDRTVQVWDMSQHWDKPPTPLHTLHTPHPIRRVAWRPEHATELVVIPNASPLSSIDPSIASIPQGLESFQAAENYLEIWDVRRHYIPKYAVPLSDGTPVDLDWWDESRLVGAFPSCFTVLDVTSDERILPLEHVPRQVLGWNGRGEMVYATDRFRPGEIPFDDPKPDLSNHWDRIGKHPKSVNDPAYEPVQALGIVQMADTDEEDFEFLAAHYRLEGGTPLQLCQWNRSVAEHCGRHDDARIWAFLQVLIEEFSHNAQTINPFSAPVSQSTVPLSPTMSPRQVVPTSGRRSPSPISLERIGDALGEVEELLPSSSASSSSSMTEGLGPKSRFQAFAPYTNKQLSDMTANTRATPSTIAAGGSGGTVNSSKYASPNVKSPPMVSSGKGTPRPLLAQALGKTDSGRRPSLQHQSNEIEELDYPDPYGVLPFAELSKMNESVVLGRASSSSGSTARGSLAASRILNASPEPGHMVSVSKAAHTTTNGPPGRSSSKSSPHMSVRPSPTSVPVRVDMPMKRVQLPPATKPDTPPDDPPWAEALSRENEFGKEAWAEYRSQRTAPLLAWWQAYVEDGVVQLASTMLVVGRRWVDFPEAQSERVVHAYLELLESHRLPVQAAYIKKYAFIPSLDVRSNDDGVTHVVHCAQCARSTGSVEMSAEEGTFWWCKRCKRNARQCVICHEPVKGLYLGCKRCSHGGHQRCMRLHYLESQPRDLSSHRRTSTDKSRTSGETYRSHSESAKQSDDAPMIKWNPCASGCGCKCRVVIGPAEVEVDEP